MNRTVCSLLVCFFSLSTFAQYTVTRFAGVDLGLGYTDGTGSSARFQQVTGLAVSSNGVVYAADYQNTIRVIAPDGVVSTAAGVPGLTGFVDGRGVDARFNTPFGVTLDSAGNLYIADFGNNAIRKMTPRGDVTTVATGVTKPYGLVLDETGTIYVTCGDYAIRKISNGVVSVLAGIPGTSGTTAAVPPRFGVILGIVMEANGDLLVMDAGNRSLRRVTRSGGVTTLGITFGYSRPEGIARDADGNLWLAAGSRVLKANLAAATVETFGSAQGVVDGPLATAMWEWVSPIASGPDGEIYLGDVSAVRRIDAGIVSTMAGQVVGSQQNVNGPLGVARLGLMGAVARATDGTIYFAERARIRKISPDGIVSDMAGGGPNNDDGKGMQAGFDQIEGLAVDRHGAVYVADYGSHLIRKMTPDGTVSTLAGTPNHCGIADGLGASALFCGPIGLAVDAADNVFVVDYKSNLVRRITPAGEVTTFAGGAASTGDPNGVGKAAWFALPADIAVDPSGNVYVGEWALPRIRKITPDAVVTTLTGTGTSGSEDGGPGVARFKGIGEVEADATGIYVLEGGNRLRKVTFDGQVSTIAGVSGESGECEGTGSIARFNHAYGLTVDGNGGLYVADMQAMTLWFARPPGIEDRATISSTTASQNTTLQLGTDQQTASAWTWSVLRRAPGSFAQLSATNIRTPTVTPDAAGRYTFLLRAENASGGLRFSTVDVDVNDARIAKRRAVR